jgi:hypothetical protein
MKLALVWAALPMAVVSLSAAAMEPCARGPGCGPGGPVCRPAHDRPYIDSCEETFFQNQIWPRQYINPSRRGICQSMERMIANGWRQQNLLGKFHFDESGQELSEAGRLKVEWILTQAPPHRRTIYVQRAAEQEQTAQRIEAVQELAANVAPSAGPADIQETHIRDDGRPAGQIDAVFVGFSQNQRAPSLTQGTSSSSSSASSSSTSGATQ